MRSHPLLSSLCNSTTQYVLNLTYMQPKREWYLSDLASQENVAPSSLQRTLAKLSRAGILRRRKDGNRVYYKADPACPIFHELNGILTKTSGIAEPLRKALIPLSRKINLAFIHGSIAESRERSESDIDIIIVGNVSNADVAIVLGPLKERLGREINMTRYTLGEFVAKVSTRHYFLSSVLKKPKIFLIGSEYELENIVGRSPSRHGASDQTGT
jgi:predicted nucleotidyltransferase